MKIGVLAAQGAFAEHIAVLRQLNAEAIPVRLPHQLAGLDGLIIPGGESTTISKLLSDFSLTDEIKDLASSGMPIFGTCAGMILMAKEISDAHAEPLKLMDIEVRRNAFGRQKESFETELSIPVIGDKPFHAVFIRAPLIEAVNGNVEILARLDNGNIVAVRQDNLLAASFHPELTDDTRFHQYFIDIITVNR
jgi:5'-phosphate synthase pdxT subunit